LANPGYKLLQWIAGKPTGQQDIKLRVRFLIINQLIKKNASSGSTFLGCRESADSKKLLVTLVMRGCTSSFQLK